MTPTPPRPPHPTTQCLDGEPKAGQWLVHVLGRGFALGSVKEWKINGDQCKSCRDNFVKEGYVSTGYWHRIRSILNYFFLTCFESFSFASTLTTLVLCHG